MWLCTNRVAPEGGPFVFAGKRRAVSQAAPAVRVRNRGSPTRKSGVRWIALTIRILPRQH